MSVDELVGERPCIPIHTESGAVREIDRDAALDRLARRCGPRATSIARSLVRNQADAEELVQEALARTHSRFDDLRDVKAIDGWFFKVLTRLCLDALRKRGRWRIVRSLWHQDESSSQRPRTDNAKLVAAVEKLADRQRVAIVLRYGGDLSLKEVAAALGVSAETAKTHLSRGLKRLRKQLGVEQ